MKKLHVTELTDGELTAVFRASVDEAVARARASGHDVPSLTPLAEAVRSKPVQTVSRRSPAKKAVA